MKVHGNQLGLRILGSVTGIGFLAIGTYAFLGPDTIDTYVRDRAHGFALAAIVGGVWAIAVSWLDSDLRGVWCRPPKRWR